MRKMLIALSAILVVTGCGKKVENKVEEPKKEVKEETTSNLVIKD